jgi:hypothetical protein
MFEFFVGDIVYYTTPEHQLAKDIIKSITSQKQKGRSKHMYLLSNGLSKQETDLFLSLKRAKNYFEQYHIDVVIPHDLDLG